MILLNKSTIFFLDGNVAIKALKHLVSQLKQKSMNI